MSMWDKTKFNYGGGYLMYGDKFVARFKYRSAPVKMSQFKRALIKYFTPDEYFAITDAGDSPMEAMRMKGILVERRVDGGPRGPMIEMIFDGKAAN